MLPQTEDWDGHNLVARLARLSDDLVMIVLGCRIAVAGMGSSTVVDRRSLAQVGSNPTRSCLSHHCCDSAVAAQAQVLLLERPPRQVTFADCCGSLSQTIRGCRSIIDSMWCLLNLVHLYVQEQAQQVLPPSEPLSSLEVGYN